ncbi:hypothetical protein [Acidiphilium sp.]|uniref:hypothetical protein n=1 Tax=Acidiphilium sp. TaxID=527 RepID=UPI003D0619CD
MTDIRWGDDGETAPVEPDGNHAGFSRDWATLWQSEFNAMAEDRELHEVWDGLLALWLRVASAVASSIPATTRHDAPRTSRPDAASRSPADFTASDPGRDAFEQFERRIAALESRLAQFERDGRPAD